MPVPVSPVIITVASVGAYVSARWKMRRIATLRPSMAPKLSLRLSGMSRDSCRGQKMMRVLPSWNSVPGLRKAEETLTPCTMVPLVLSRSRIW